MYAAPERVKRRFPSQRSVSMLHTPLDTSKGGRYARHDAPRPGLVTYPSSTSGGNVKRWKTLVVAMFLGIGTACVPPVFPEDSLPFYEERPIVGAFSAGYDEVWSATMEAMDLYAVELSEKERGLIVTEWQLSTSDYVFAQYGATRIPAKIKYRIRVHVKSQDGRTLVKIINHEQVEKDMISGNLEFSGAIYNWIDVPSSTSKEREILEKIRKNLGMNSGPTTEG